LGVIAVTGASGFVGQHFCEIANSAGIRVRAVPRGALCGQDLVQFLSGADAVVHLAARAHRRRGGVGDPSGAFQTDNVELTGRIGEACEGAGVRRLIFVSSAGVLGRCSPPEGFSDDSPPAPHDAYTQSKFAAEQLIRRRFADSLETVIIRPPLVYGPGATGSFSRIMQLATSSWPLPLGAMRAPRSLISVRNLCDLLLRVTHAPEASGRCLLVADAEITSVADLVASIRAAAGRHPRLIRVPTAAVAFALTLAGRRDDLPGLVSPFVVRTSSALAGLDWVSPFRQPDEIRWTVASYASASGRL
jgi:UDP-glucose 4-epimerase